MSATDEKHLIRPYGDRKDDGVIQLSFVLPVPASEQAKEAAATVAKKLSIRKLLPRPTPPWKYTPRGTSGGENRRFRRDEHHAQPARVGAQSLAGGIIHGFPVERHRPGVRRLESRDRGGLAQPTVGPPRGAHA